MFEKILHYAQEYKDGKIDFLTLESTVDALLSASNGSKPNVNGSLPPNLHECPVCKQKAGKTYLAAKLPTVCQSCDHIWMRG